MLQRLAICTASVGWIAPFFAAAHLLMRHVELLGAGTLAQHSFPHLRTSSQLFALAMIRLSLVIVVWTWRLTQP